MVAKIKIRFDRANPKAIEQAQKKAADLVTKVSETTRKAIRATVVKGFEEGIDVRNMAKEIAELVDSKKRAMLIARTETMTAANEGQRQLWGQAVDEGLLIGTERQVWIVTNDDRLCAVCEPMDGVTAPLGGEFEVDGEMLDGPPAHPNCRCTIGFL